MKSTLTNITTQYQVRNENGNRRIVTLNEAATDPDIIGEMQPSMTNTYSSALVVPAVIDPVTEEILKPSRTIYLKAMSTKDMNKLNTKLQDAQFSSSTQTIQDNSDN